jgi:hypothetical protein|tara:strand:+ start:154 stop:639 length:486 start_codon:yes stop_codon:yes gene_type:complete
MSYLYGTQARVYGIGGRVMKPSENNSNTVWSSLTASTVCIITGYTYTPAVAGAVEGYDQTGRLTSEAFAYATFEMTINFEFGSTTTSGGVADSKGLKMPDLMAVIELTGMDNSDLNGVYNFRSGSVTGSNQGWKTGTMTLRAISNSANIQAANKGSLAAIS